MSETKIHLISAYAPNGVGEYRWETPESVQAVPEDLALSLLRIRGAGFSVAEPYEALPTKRPGRPKKEPVTPEANTTPEPEVAAGPVENQLGNALDLISPKGTSGRKAS